jgi:hypothetical protein
MHHRQYPSESTCTLYVSTSSGSLSGKLQEKNKYLNWVFRIWIHILQTVVVVIIIIIIIGNTLVENVK